MSDADDISESVDGDMLGEEPFDADQPGVGTFPPEHALGVDDPSLYESDDMETRRLRRYVESDDNLPDVVIIEENASTLDVEKDLVAEGYDISGSGIAPEEFSAEEAAMHIVDEG